MNERDRWELAIERAKRIAEDSSVGNLVDTVSHDASIRVPDHANVQIVDGGAFVDAVIFVKLP